MSVFFGGRLHTTPAVLSKVDDTRMLAQGVSTPNIPLMIGKAAGGKPNTLLRFGSPQEAEAVLVSGDLLEAVKRAFDPSAETNAPAEVDAIRVDPATQSSLALKDALSATVATLTSTGYGLRENQIKVKIEAATVRGLKVTTQREDDYFTEDNIFRDAFKVRYNGALASAVMTTSASQVTLQAPSGTTVATIALADYPTIQKLVDRINAVPGFSASVLDGNGERASLNGLDAVTSQDVKTADFVQPANLQAFVDWFNSNSEGFVGCTRANDVGTVPAALPFTYLSGGSDGVVSNTNWTDAFSVAQTADVQWVVPLTTDPAVHAMADTHVKFMSDVAQKERRCAVGAPLATTDDAALTLAKAFNSDRMSLIHLGGYDFDANGVNTLYPPYIVAAMYAAAFCGLSPGEPMTNKSLKLRGLERKLKVPLDTDALIKGGVVAMIDTPTGFRVCKSISTWLTNDSYYRVEQSVGVALDFVSREVRAELDSLKGGKNSPTAMAEARARTERKLIQLATPEPNGPGVLVGDAQSPPYRNLRVSIEGDRLSVIFECSPAIPTNYVTVTIHAVPYSGTLAA